MNGPVLWLSLAGMGLIGYVVGLITAQVLCYIVMKKLR